MILLELHTKMKLVGLTDQQILLIAYLRILTPYGATHHPSGRFNLADYYSLTDPEDDHPIIS